MWAIEFNIWGTRDYDGDVRSKTGHATVTFRFEDGRTETIGAHPGDQGVFGGIGYIQEDPDNSETDRRSTTQRVVLSESEFTRVWEIYEDQIGSPFYYTGTGEISWGDNCYTFAREVFDEIDYTSSPQLVGNPEFEQIFTIDNIRETGPAPIWAYHAPGLFAQYIGSLPAELVQQAQAEWWAAAQYFAGGLDNSIASLFSDHIYRVQNGAVETIQSISDASVTAINHASEFGEQLLDDITQLIENLLQPNLSVIHARVRDQYQFSSSITSSNSDIGWISFFGYLIDDAPAYAYTIGTSEEPLFSLPGQVSVILQKDVEINATHEDDVIFFLIHGSNIFGSSGEDTAIFSLLSNALFASLDDGIARDLQNEGVSTQLNNFENLTGTNYGDFLEGRDNDNTLVGLDGNDTIYGLGGDDRIEAGDGNDRAYGGDDDDRLFGGEGNDTLYGNNDDDHLQGDEGRDTLFGGSDDDTLFGGDGDDELFGGSNDDYLQGGDDDDHLEGGSGNDELSGGRDDDTLLGEDGRDDLNGGSGDDILWGGQDDDELSGGSGNDTLVGGAGHDNLEGNDGHDDLHGREGDDTLFGGDGDDTLEGGSGNDLIYGGAGSDTVYLNNDFSDYTVVALGDGGVRFVDNGQIDYDGTTTVYDVENFVFANADYSFGDLPVLRVEAEDDYLSVDAGVSVHIDPIANDSSNADILNVNSARIVSGLGTLVVHQGFIDLQFASTDYQGLNAGETETVEIEYEILGIEGDLALADRASIFVEVQGVDDEALAQGQSIISVYENSGPLQGEISIFDPDHGQNPTFANANLSKGYGSIQVSEDGSTFTYTVYEHVSQWLDYGETITEAYTLYANDGTDFTFIATIHGWDDFAPLEAQEVQSSDSHEAVSLSSNNDRFEGQEGDDIVHGNQGEDRLWGEQGDDQLFGGTGSDLLYGGLGDDFMDGGDGDDYLTSAEGDDHVFGGSGDDRIRGRDGDDVLYGGNDNDDIYGHDGADQLFGGAGDDDLWGSSGDDEISGDQGNDEMGGGSGADTLDGGNGNDDIEGDSGDDLLFGGLGDDIINGGSGYDLVRINAELSSIAFEHNNGTFTIASADGVDVISEVEEFQFNDQTVTLNQLLETEVTGYDHVASGTSDNDRLVAQTGTNHMTGGAGADEFVFVEGTQGSVISDYEAGVDRINLSAFVTNADLIRRTIDDASYDMYMCRWFSDQPLDNVEFSMVQAGQDVELYVDYFGFNENGRKPELLVTLQNTDVDDMSLSDLGLWRSEFDLV